MGVGKGGGEEGDEGIKAGGFEGLDGFEESFEVVNFGGDGVERVRGVNVGKEECGVDLGVIGRDEAR